MVNGEWSLVGIRVVRQPSGLGGAQTPFTIYHSPFTNSQPLEDADDVREVVAPDDGFVLALVERLPARVRRERAEVCRGARDDHPGRRGFAGLRVVFSIAEGAGDTPRCARHAADDAFEFERAVRRVEDYQPARRELREVERER